MTYGFINTAVIVLRLSDEDECYLDTDSEEDLFDQEQKEGSKDSFKLLAPYSFIVVSFIATLTISLKLAFPLQVAAHTLVVVNYLFLSYMVHQKEKTQSEASEPLLDGYKPPEQDFKQKIAEMKAKKEQMGFRCPLVPLIPCLGTYVNFLFCVLGVEGGVWLLFLGFEALGAFIYYFFGFNRRK